MHTNATVMRALNSVREKEREREKISLQRKINILEKRVDI